MFLGNESDIAMMIGGDRWGNVQQMLKKDEALSPESPKSGGQRSSRVMGTGGRGGVYRTQDDPPYRSKRPF